MCSIRATTCPTRHDLYPAVKIPSQPTTTQPLMNFPPLSSDAQNFLAKHGLTAPPNVPKKKTRVCNVTELSFCTPPLLVGIVLIRWIICRGSCLVWVASPTHTWSKNRRKEKMVFELHSLFLLQCVRVGGNVIFWGITLLLVLPGHCKLTQPYQYALRNCA